MALVRPGKEFVIIIFFILKRLGCPNETLRERLSVPMGLRHPILAVQRPANEVEHGDRVFPSPAELPLAKTIAPSGLRSPKEDMAQMFKRLTPIVGEQKVGQGKQAVAMGVEPKSIGLVEQDDNISESVRLSSQPRQRSDLGAVGARFIPTQVNSNRSEMNRKPSRRVVRLRKRLLRFRDPFAKTPDQASSVLVADAWRVLWRVLDVASNENTSWSKSYLGAVFSQVANGRFKSKG